MVIGNRFFIFFIYFFLSQLPLFPGSLTWSAMEELAYAPPPVASSGGLLMFMSSLGLLLPLSEPTDVSQWRPAEQPVAS